MTYLEQKGSVFLKKNYSKFSAPCFYCTADSAELKTFLILTIGGLALCSVFVCFGLYLRGSFNNTEELNDMPLKIEEQDLNNE